MGEFDLIRLIAYVQTTIQVVAMSASAGIICKDALD